MLGSYASQLCTMVVAAVEAGQADIVRRCYAVASRAVAQGSTHRSMLSATAVSGIVTTLALEAASAGTRTGMDTGISALVSSADAADVLTPSFRNLFSVSGMEVAVLEAMPAPVLDPQQQQQQPSLDAPSSGSSTDMTVIIAAVVTSVAVIAAAVGGYFWWRMQKQRARRHAEQIRKEIKKKEELRSSWTKPLPEDGQMSDLNSQAGSSSDEPVTAAIRIQGVI